MKEKQSRFPLYDAENRFTDLSGCRYRVLGLAAFDSMSGQGEAEFVWKYLCMTEQGEPVLITEDFDIHVYWAARRVCPENVERSDLYALIEEPLSREEFYAYQKQAKPMDGKTVSLPITLNLPTPPVARPNRDGKLT